MKVLAIVITYNGSKWLDKCFGSLLQSSIPVKIITIDNGSTDGTPEIIKEKFPNSELIVSKINLGFGQANNIGLKKALEDGADYVFLINQDAWIEKETIRSLIDAHKQFPEYGIISPIHLDGAGTGFDYGFLNYLCRNKEKTFLNELYAKEKNQFNIIYPLDFINAAFWLIPKNTLETVGGFNPIFFHYGEDREYVIRSLYFGLKVGFVPSAIGYHDRQQQDTDFKKLSLIKATLLIKALNPNQRFSWLDASGSALKRGMMRLISGDFNVSINYLTVVYSLLINSRTIAHTKRQIKRQGPTYLTK